MINLFVSLVHDSIAYLLKKPAYLIITLIISIAWSYILTAYLHTNRFGFYVIGHLKWSALLMPVFFLALSILIGYLIFPKFDEYPAKARLRTLIVSLSISIIFIWLLPPPLPVLSIEHTLQIISSGEKNESAIGNAIEIRKLRYLNQAPVNLGDFDLTGDWFEKGGKLISEGQDKSSVAKLSGRMPVGIELTFRYNVDAGRATVIWDGIKSEHDLYFPNGWSGSVVFNGFSWVRLSLYQKLFIGIIFTLYILGFASIVFLTIVVFELQVFKSVILKFLLVALNLLIFLLYFNQKLSFAQLNAERVYNDTYSYALSAEIPLSSLRFWANERSFSLPLVYKLLEVNTDNYTDQGILKRVVRFQTWLTIFSWTALGLAVTKSIRHPWMRPLAFGIILMFNLNLELSIWESLLLSESVSFSLFALLLASWIILFTMSQKRLHSILGYSTFAIMMLITVLYSFTRDSNLYFVLAGASVFGFASIVKYLKGSRGRLNLIYFGLVIGLFFLQNLTINIGNRWHPRIFNHLAMRTFGNEEATNYFIEAGLPVSELLFELEDMSGKDQKDFLRDTPELEPVREWVNLKGRTAFLGYLISHPSELLIEPIRQSASLINGNNIEFRLSRNPIEPIPRDIRALSEKLYPRNPWMLTGIITLILIGGLIYWHAHDRDQLLWLIIAVLIISIYPLMVIVWNGDALEVERHSAQIGVQFRLAGWLSLILLLDYFPVIVHKSDEVRKFNPYS